jgi:hypothetical protein
MKKYKIIKTYPGSDKLGTIITLDKNGECWSTPQLVIENDCKHHPEFFEEIIQKQYEILFYHCKSLGHTLKASQFTDTQFGGNSEWSIYSIRRLNDSEVFSIGDVLVDTFNKSQGSFTLKEIEFESAPCDKGTGKLSFVHTHQILGKYIPLERLQKAKPVLFVTEDGVSVVENDNVHWVINGKYAYELRICEAHIKSSLLERDVYKIFSSFEKAQDFILMNKPILSIKDLLDLAKECNDNLCISSADPQYCQSDFEKLTALVKSRL